MMAVLPAAFLMAYVWQMDPVDKEPLPLLAKLFLFGMLSTLPAILIETAASDALLGSAMPQDLDSLLLMNFAIVAVTEECSKYVFLRLASWHDRNFDYVFDGIVYAVFCGLGFAVAENISYVFTFGPGAAIVRAFTAIPGHCVFAVFMGSFYGRTKLAQVQQRHIPRLWNGLLSLAVPIFCHGRCRLLRVPPHPCAHRLCCREACLTACRAHICLVLAQAQDRLSAPSCHPSSFRSASF